MAAAGASLRGLLLVSPPSCTHHTPFPHGADNEAIVAGYRRVMPFWEAAASMFALHNETMNVWTHAMGALTFVGLAVYVAVGGIDVTPGGADYARLGTSVEAAEDSPIIPVLEGAAHAVHNMVLHALPSLRSLKIDEGHEAPADAVVAAGAPGSSGTPRATAPAVIPTWPILVFLASAITLLVASATYHQFHIVRRTWFNVLSKLDYAAIAILIAGSSVPALYYAFYCAPTLLRVYQTLNTTTCATALVVGLHPRFADLRYRLVRMSTFIATGLFAGVPFVHMLIATDLQVGEAVYGLLLMGALYISGALLYGFRIPERWAPGRFDLFGASHQLFHIAVVAAALVHYLTVVSHYHWRVHHAECAAAA